LCCVRRSGILLFPLKLLTLWLFTHKHLLLAGLSSPLPSWPALASLRSCSSDEAEASADGRFRWLYEHILIWLAWRHLVDPIRDRIRP